MTYNEVGRAKHSSFLEKQSWGPFGESESSRHHRALAWASFESPGQLGCPWLSRKGAGCLSPDIRARAMEAGREEERMKNTY